MTACTEPAKALRTINRQFSATSYVRQLSSSSWSSLNSAVSRNSSGSNKQFTRVEVNVENIRSLVLAEINKNPQLYHGNDVIKIEANHWFIDRFIKDENDSTSPYFQDPSTIVKSIIECLKWRNEIGINDVKAINFPKEFYDTALFSMGPLDDASMMLYLTGRRFKRMDGFADLWIDFFLYCYETQYDTLKEGIKLIVMVDVSEVGVSGVDLPLFFKLMTIVLKYYPSLVTKVFILEMSWIFKPIVKVIFAVLPKKFSNMVEFVWMDDLKTKVGYDKIPDFMGGQVKTYRIQPPPNCVSLEEIARSKGLTENQITKAKKTLKGISRQMEREELESKENKNINIG